MTRYATANNERQSFVGESARAYGGLRRRAKALLAAPEWPEYAFVRIRRPTGEKFCPGNGRGRDASSVCRDAERTASGLRPNPDDVSPAETASSFDGSCESGRTMIEMLVIVSVAAGLTVGGIRSQAQYQANIRDEVVAQQMREVIKAASAYIQANAAAVDAAAATPMQIPVTLLQAANYLPAGFQNTNTYGQTYTVLVRQVTPGVDQALVVTTGGTAIPDGRLPQIAARIGSDGGFIASTAATVAQGAFGGWQMPVFTASGTTPAAGHLASSVFFNDSTILADYLYRVPVPGQPDANRMHTNMDMGGYGITGANTIGANTVTATNTVSANSISATTSVSANTVSATTVSIGGQSVDASRAALLNQIYGTTCPTGQVLTAQGGTASCVYSVPQHAIAAFDTACPPGWTAFAAGTGRFLVGTGSDGQLHANGQLYSYGLNETGGNAAVTLVLGNLPLNFPNTGSTANSGNKAEPGTTTPAPINVLPPYTAVNWCQKT